MLLVFWKQRQAERTDRKTILFGVPILSVKPQGAQGLARSLKEI